MHHSIYLNHIYIYIYIYETFPKKAMAKVLVNGYVFLQLVKCLFE